MKQIAYFRMILFLLLPGIALSLSPLVQAQTPGTPTPAQQLDLGQSLEKTLQAEQKLKDELEQRLNYALRFEKDIETEFNAYKIQISAYTNLLLIPNTPLPELEKIRENVSAAIAQIDGRLKELIKERNTLDQQRLTTEEQYALNQKQLNEIQTGAAQRPSESSEAKALLEKLHTLTNVLDSKRHILERMQIIYTQHITHLEEIRHDFQLLLDKLQTHLDERKTRELFERKANPLTLLGEQQILLEVQILLDQLHTLTRAEFWRNMGATLWKSEGYVLIRILILFGIIELLFFRIRRFFKHLEQQSHCDTFPRRCFLLRLASQSLLLGGATLFFYIYTQVRQIPLTALTVIVRLLMAWLFSRWALDFLTLWKEQRGEQAPLNVVTQLRALILVVWTLSIAYILGEWVLSSTSVLLLLGRIIFEVSLFLWSLFFWKLFWATPGQIFPGTSRLRHTIRGTVIVLGYIIASGGLAAELAGYGQLALYWYISWGKSLVVCLWSLLIILVLQEWEQELHDAVLPERDEAAKTARQIRWVFIRLSWLLWLAILVVGLMLAWGAKRIVIASTFSVLTFPVYIGGMKLSLAGLIYAFFILAFTHFAALFWKHLLRERILVNSGLEIGIQVSITTISVYLFWLFGILWALNSIGVGTTSLAVAFGALGIGLGFGLQSIFNNFISGLILLFERPIEVGDVIEVGGIWGSVAKINVRATVVRTFDNAALIIPNSDIITNQLTNWTFKDVKMRRTITVGVAYGSDAKLVERTLYAIAEQHPRVLTDPAPMVLFSDFGDSALKFMLRVWTILDYGLTTENDIRFEIVRQFQELGIEIPFPQRDLHIRSTAIPPASEEVATE